MSQLHNLLLKVEEEAHKASYRKSIGICGLVTILAGYAGLNGAQRELLQSELMRLYKQWPGYSGNERYPVPHGSGPREGFLYRKNLWADDEYGNMRRSLLAYLIERTKS